MVKFFAVALLIISLAIPVLATSTKIYVWRNEEGVLVFSDSPRPGAEEVDVPDANIMKSGDTSVLDIKPQEIDNNYVVEITQPQDNATVRDNRGSVHVTGIIKPIFKRGLRIQLNIDGKPYEKPQTHTRFALRNIERGEHQIKMDLLDQKGKVIASSEPITFYMHRASVIKAR